MSWLPAGAPSPAGLPNQTSGKSGSAMGSKTSLDSPAPAVLSETWLAMLGLSPNRPGSLLMRLLSTYGTLIALGLMIVIFSIVEPDTFATFGNFRNIFTDMAIGTIIAAGLTVPLVGGDFDLSIGYVASFC